MGALIALAVMGADLASAEVVWETAARPEKERELLFVGEQYCRAIGNYFHAAPGAAKEFPASLDDLILDRRHPVARRHLRKKFRDPITGSLDWGLVRGPGGAHRGRLQPFGARADQDRRIPASAGGLFRSDALCPMTLRPRPVRGRCAEGGAMSSIVSFHPDDLEWLARTMDASLAVQRRPQFFLWARGQLQSLLPHGTLFCASMDPDSRVPRFDVFAGAPYDEGRLAEILLPGKGLLVRAMKVWEDSGERPPACKRGAARHRAAPAHPAGARALRPGQHGGPQRARLRWPDGDVFRFLPDSAAPGPRYGYVLDLLVPHLHRAFLRL
jgi:hypothetical protein